MAKRNGRTTLKGMQEENRALYDGMEMLQERIAELELYQEDLGWERLSGESDREFSREFLGTIIRQSRLAYLKSPLINRAVKVQAYYVWGQGVNVQATDPEVDRIVGEFRADPANRAELTSHQARMLKEIDLQVLGNLFFVFFVGPTGRVTVRTIPVDEVQEIITNPQDIREPWFYRRVWTEGGRQRAVYYPDWRKPPAVALSVPGSAEVASEPVYHVRVGGMTDMRFGVPEVYPAVDWAKAYKSFLEDRATVARALSRFAAQLTTRGGPKGVAAAKAKLGAVSAGEQGPAPVTGSVFVGSEGTRLDPVRVAGATIHPEEGRRFLLMVCATVGLPETYFGDVSVGTLATATSLDRPTELKFRDRQSLWADVLGNIYGFVLDQQIGQPGSRIGPNTDRTVDVSFPDLLEHNIGERIDAIIDASTLKGLSLKGTIDLRQATALLLRALGEDDVDTAMARLFPADQYPEEELIWERDELVARALPVEDDEPFGESRLAEAVRRLAEVVRDRRGD